MEASRPVESPPEPATSVRPAPRRRRLWPLLFLALPILVGAAALFLNEPIDRPSTPGSGPKPGPETPIVRSAEAPPTPTTAPTWPEKTIEGPEAKRFLLAYLKRVGQELEAVDSYTALFHKQERIAGKLGPTTTMRMKVRHRPFSVYFKNVEPLAGREVLFVEGKHDDKLIVHNNDISALLVPRLAVDPTGRPALADNRHPITEAGLANLVGKLTHFRKMDIEDEDARTILDRSTDDDGHTWYRSVHLHTQRNPERPFERIEVLYDPETRLPHQITSYDWPITEGRVDVDRLAEKYTYDEVKLGLGLGEEDFSTANPEYNFQRKLK